MVKTNKQIISWKYLVIPGTIIFTVVTLLRALGWLQGWEWQLFDIMLRSRPLESPDERIVIVGIGEQDIQSTLQSYPISDQDLAQLINQLEQYDPIAIGLDIVRDLPTPPGTTELNRIFETRDNIFGVYTLIGLTPIAPNPTLKAKGQIGFVDTITDDDGNYRRLLLEQFRENNDHHDGPDYSLPLMLADYYLNKNYGFVLEFGRRDQMAMAFKQEEPLSNPPSVPPFVELPRFTQNTGAYVRADDGGVQILGQFRHHPQPFPELSFTDVINHNFAPEQIEGKIVLIGITATSEKDFVDTKATLQNHSINKIYGVHFLAHNTSQLISEVLDGERGLTSLPEVGEYLWILGWTGLMLLVIKRSQSLPFFILIYGVSQGALVFGSYGLLLGGWWLPVVPVLIINTVLAVAYLYYRYNFDFLSQELAIRQNAINEFFEEIHRTALQRCSLLSRALEDPDFDPSNLRQEIIAIDQDIRQAYETIEAFFDHHDQRVNPQDLETKINKLFQQQLDQILIKYQLNHLALITNFEPYCNHNLTQNQIYKLTQLIEEMICNIYKHGVNVKRIKVEGTMQDVGYILSFENSGQPIDQAGIKQLEHKKFIKRLEQALNGSFTVKALDQGTLCQFRW
ncbi:MAG: CHASE2 domain-containing protein [Synechococcaceae cyanobacterium RL_1_2]|nr:CHASE2 domain-containing protein [Synechococcaceae cyanobacterium RL_1_2]